LKNTDGGATGVQQHNLEGDHNEEQAHRGHIQQGQKQEGEPQQGQSHMNKQGKYLTLYP